MAATTPARSETRTLTGAARTFWRFPGPRILYGSLAAVLAARLVLGGWDWEQGVMILAIVAVQPLTEWILHVTLLHMRPRTVLGLRYDPLVAREHRRHHQDPRDLALGFIPLPVLAQLLLLIGLISALGPSWQMRLTMASTMLALGSLYEWTHFLIHSDYKPRGAVYRLIYTKHRLHHYRNERYWFGVTSPLGDVVLRTNPGRDAVPVSPTCKTLGLPAVSARPAG